MRVIEEEMAKLQKHLREMISTVDMEYVKFVGNIQMYQRAMNRLKGYEVLLKKMRGLGNNEGAAAENGWDQKNYSINR